MLEACIETRATLAELKQAADKGIAQRQTASRSLHDLAALGVLREMPFGKERLFIHPELMQMLSRDSNPFQPCA